VTPDNVDRSFLIDISAAVNQGAGIGRYARELTRCLIPLLPAVCTKLWYAPEEPMYEEMLLHCSPWNGVPIARSTFSRQNLDRLAIRHQLPIGRFLRLGRPTDIYSPDFTAPPAAAARTHVTVHDLAWLHPEAETPKPLVDFLEPVVDRAVRTAATVFTVSETIRQETLEHYQLSEETVLVAPNAADERFFKAPPLDDAALLTIGVRRPFLLYVGTIEPRKNVAKLVDAIDRLPAELHLVLAGKDGWEASFIWRQIDHSHSRNRVVRAGYVPDNQLPRIIASAAAVVYPSRYEGFGLPVIEALAAGVPIAASDLPVFHEVGGPEVEFFDPMDSSDVARAIERALSSDQESAAARARRRAWARRFDWHSSAAVVARRLLAMA
jgi:glycosyltransferase involved in cell wall biosynthesis